MESKNGFDQAVSIAFSGLPVDIKVSPANVSLSPGHSTQLSFSAAPYLQASTYSVTVMGTGAGLSPHTAPLSLKITSYPGNTTIPRTRYVRTDAVTEYFLSQNSHWIVYNAPTKRFFATDPSGNRVMVMDAVTRTKIGSIVVPGACGIDDSTDRGTIFVGTLIGDVYAIDPETMAVIRRYTAGQIGPSGYLASSVLGLANGELALLGEGSPVSGIGGRGTFAIWDPATNALEVHGNSLNPGDCADQGASDFTRTGDRALVISLPTFHGVCSFDPATGASNFADVPGFPVVGTPDGKSILVVQPGTVQIPQGNPPPQIAVLDAKTLAPISTFSLSADTNGTSAMFVSPDSKTVYVSEGMWESIVYAYDIGSGELIGWLPSIFVSPISGGMAVGPIDNPNYQAVDESGLAAGPLEEGIGFLDTTALQTGPVGIQLTNGFLNPATGPASGGTQVQIPSERNLDALYFGQNKLTEVFATGAYGPLTVTTPAAPAGVVDVYQLFADGNMQILPDAFSYGPTVLEASADMSTAEGGGTGVLFGYGFGPEVVPSSIPADLQITVGGKAAQAEWFNDNAYGAEYIPYLLQSVAYTLPAGAAGQSEDIEVTTTSGSTTVSNGIHYLPAVRQFPLNGASLAQGVYDSKRDLYYFSDAAAVQVFSKTQGKWLSPFPIPAAPGGHKHRLWGIALSADGSHLAVGDYSLGMVYLFDPDSAASVRTFALQNAAGNGIFPAGLAVNNAGTVIMVAESDVFGSFDDVFVLDTNTGKISVLNVPTGATAQSRVVFAADGTAVYLNSNGTVGSVELENGTVHYASNYPADSGNYDLALSADQSVVAASNWLFDAHLNATSYLTMNDREVSTASSVYGVKLSPDGRLLFQPSEQGIDVYDGRLGVLLHRIALPMPLSKNFDALVSDGVDNILIAITGQGGTGVAVVDLTSLAEPTPLPYLDTVRSEALPWPQNKFHSRAPNTERESRGRAPTD